MLERQECKVSLILLLLFSILAVVSNVAALILTILWGNLGFNMNTTNSSYLCSVYLTLKLNQNLILVYNVIFIGGCISLFFQFTAVICLIYLSVKYCKSNNKNYQELTEFLIRLLWIDFSVGLLGLCVSVGYYGTFIIQQGLFCLNYIYFDWLILGGLFAAALLFVLICWLILLCFWNRKKNKFGEIPHPQFTQKSSEAEQPINIIELFQHLKEAIKKETLIEPRQIKKPLLEEQFSEGEEEQDQYVLANEKQKLEIITFQQYKRRVDQQKQKQYQDQQIINQLMQQQDDKMMRQQDQKILVQMQAQRQKNKAFGELALSPNDPNFNKIFQESESQQQNRNSRILSVRDPKEEYFPANFTPQNEQEKTAFQKYKKKLLQKYKRTGMVNNSSILSKLSQPDNPLYRHPQNIQGGRSKRLMRKYFKIFKRPQRDESIYFKTLGPKQDQDKNKFVFNIQDQNEESSYKSAAFKQINDTLVKQQLQEKVPASSFYKSSIISAKQVEFQVLYFQKQKTKTNIRKKLFEEDENSFRSKQLSSLTSQSILSSLVKGVEEITFKNRLKELRQKRNEGSPANKGVKRSQKLIESIRSKFT